MNTALQQHNEVQEWHTLIAGYDIPGGVILIPESMIPSGQSLDEFAEEWRRATGPLMYRDNVKLDGKIIQRIHKEPTIASELKKFNEANKRKEMEDRLIYVERMRRDKAEFELEATDLCKHCGEKIRFENHFGWFHLAGRWKPVDNGMKCYNTPNSTSAHPKE